MKKKQRCLLKRFAALVAAMMLSVSLCVPAFASNNASSQKWVIVGEEMLIGENGQSTKYFHLTPYSDGNVYSAVIMSRSATAQAYMDASAGYSYVYGMQCLNYPDWWRSNLPLGANSYIEIFPSSFRTYSSPISTSYTNSSYGSLRVFDVSNALDYTISAGLTFGDSVSDKLSSSISTPNTVCPVFLTTWANYDHSGKVQNSVSASVIPLTLNTSTRVRLSSNNNVVVSFPFNTSPSNGSNLYGAALAPLFNLSSDNLVIGCETGSSNTYSCIIAQISFWVDANKLPAGLQVGDEFPANTDAFDQMRDTLIDQFPEASENIQNGKSTLTGWNDTETVDTDVASSAMSALNAMFQNLGSFLFIISLMVFGAVVLRMFIKKAVDG